MCGRYHLTTPIEGLRQLFLFEELPNLAPRYNIAPTQAVPVIRRGAEDGRRHFALLRWGLIPSWAKDAGIGSRMINARAESVADKPAFRSAFRRRRCLVPADGFFEWQKREEGKQPFRIARPDGGAFAFAGLWERWRDPAGDGPVESFTIITTDANAQLRPIHERMPVILDPEAFDLWLDPQAPLDGLQALLGPYREEGLIAIPISTRVNNVRFDDAAVLVPEEAPVQQSLL